MLKSNEDKKQSKAVQRKEEKSFYWRNQQECSWEMENARKEFAKNVEVLSHSTTSKLKSYSAIIDSRRGIIVK